MRPYFFSIQCTTDGLAIRQMLLLTSAMSPVEVYLPTCISQPKPLMVAECLIDKAKFSDKGLILLKVKMTTTVKRPHAVSLGTQVALE